MKIYDCFIFNDEIDLLKLRLNFLNDHVDYFVLVESERTHTGLKKPLHFKHYEFEFEQFLHKIIYLQAPDNDLNTTEYEFFQRNYIKEGLKNCEENDIVHICDVDEILNLKEILPLVKTHDAALVSVPMFYYWFNLKSNVSWMYNLIGKWHFIREIDIGLRNFHYRLNVPVIKSSGIITGWHFSYLFGTDISKYQNKIKSFSHQEYSNSYYLNSKRIHRCVLLGVDLYGRPEMSFHYTKEHLTPLLPYIRQLHLANLIQTEKKNYSFEDLIFLMLNIYPKKTLYFISLPFTYVFSKMKSVLKKVYKFFLPK